jgi:hypothetical protein
VRLKNGRAEVDIDADAGMMPGTFEALTQQPDVFLQNITGWSRIKVENLNALPSGRFTIIAEDPDSADEVSWLAIAERGDRFIKASETTDDDGHLIPEVFKPEPTEAELAELQDAERYVERTEAAGDMETTVVVSNLLGRRGFPMHPEALNRQPPQRKVTIKTVVREQADKNKDEE